MRYLVFSSLIFIQLLLTSCGYTFIGGGSVLPVDVKKIYIQMAENDTTESSLSMTFTEALQDQFERYGAVIIVDKISDADAILRSKIVSVDRSTKTSTSGTDTALQYDVRMTAAVELQRVTGQVLWRNNSMSAAQTYGATSEVVVTNSADFAMSSLDASDLSGMSSREVARSQESEALVKIAEKIAKNVYDQAVAPEF